MAESPHTDGGRMDVEQLFACVVCDKRERTGWFLRCLHSCCEECLEKSGSSVRCPVCTTTTTNGGNLPQNHLKEIAQLKTKLAEPQVCFLCKYNDQKNIGTYLCVECDHCHMCEICLKSHGTHPATKTHKPIALTELFNEENRNVALEMAQPTPTCLDHHTKESPQLLNLYCESCEKCVCHTCLMVGHREGAHKIMTLKDFAQNKRVQLEDDINACTPMLGEIANRVQNITGKKHAKKMEREQVCNELNERMAALKKIIDDIGNAYLAQIAAVYDEQDALDERDITELNKRREQIEHISSVTKLFEQISSDTDMVAYKQFFSTCLTEARHLSDRQTRYKTVNIKNVTNDSAVLIDLKNTFDLRNMIGQLEVTYDTVAGCIGQLEIGKQCKVEALQTLDVKELQIINGFDITSEGDILIAGTMKSNTEPCIAVYNSDGRKLSPVKHNIHNVWQITLDEDAIYVGNGNEKCVTVLNKQGAVQNVIKPSVGLSDRVGVTVHERRLYFTGYKQNKIYSCNKGGDGVTEWVPALSNQLEGPQYLCTTPKGDIAVSQSTWTGHCITLISHEKQVMFTYGSKESGDGQLWNPQGLCSDSDGRIYIADRYYDRVSIVSPSGQFIANIVTQEDGIQSPRDVKIWKDRVIVAHSNSKITIFKVITP